MKKEEDEARAKKEAEAKKVQKGTMREEPKAPNTNVCVCWGPAFFGKQRDVTAVPPTAPIRQYFVEGLCCLAAGCALRCVFLVVVAPRYLLPRSSKLCSTRLSKPLALSISLSSLFSSFLSVPLCPLISQSLLY